MSVFQVPTPSDNENDIAAAGARLRSVSTELDTHHAQLVAAGAFGTAQWVGAASSQFASTHTTGLEQLKKISAAHLAHAEAHDHYSSHVSSTKDIGVQVHGAISGHIDDYQVRVRQQLDALHREANHKFEEAKQHAENAGSDLLSGNIIGAIGQGWDAATSAFEGIADSAVEGLLSELLSWQPVVPALQLTAMSLHADPFVDLTSGVVLNELTALGDFLASGMLEMFRDVLDAMGLSAAANAVGAVEDEFIANAVAAHRRATQAMRELVATAERIAGELTHVVETGLVEFWHATEQVTGAVVHGVEDVADWAAKHPWDALADVCAVLSLLPIPPVDLIAAGIGVGIAAYNTVQDVREGKPWYDTALDAAGVILPVGLGGTAKILANGAKTADNIEKAAVNTEHAVTEADQAVHAASVATKAQQLADNGAQLGLKSSERLGTYSQNMADQAAAHLGTADRYLNQASQQLASASTATSKASMKVASALAKHSSLQLTSKGLEAASQTVETYDKIDTTAQLGIGIIRQKVAAGAAG